MNKICTSKEQSQKLIDLGIDVSTADMLWHRTLGGIYIPRINDIITKLDIPAWSLAALLEHLRRIDMFPDIIDSGDCVLMDISFADDEDGKVHCLRVEGKTILDVCYEMILKLNERKLL